MKGRASKLSGKIGISEKYYSTEALRCDQSNLVNLKAWRKKGKKENEAASDLPCFFVVKKTFPHICSLKRWICLS